MFAKMKLIKLLSYSEFKDCSKINLDKCVYAKKESESMFFFEK